MTKSKVLIFCSLSFAGGIFLASAFFVPQNFILILTGINVLGFALSFYLEKKFWSFLFFFLSFAVLGMWRLNVSMVESQFADLFNSKTTLDGYVIEDPSVRDNNQLINFLPDGYSQSIRVNTTLVQKFFYGDRIVVTGKVEVPENFNGFDYQKYLERYNTYAVVDYPKILILKSHQLNPVKEFLLNIKYWFISRLSALYLEPQNSLALGMLIGGHGTMPKQTVENFNNTGTSHIIAVSGFNITIIVGFLTSLAYVFGRKASFYIATLTIISFVVITGLSASAVRAGIMGFLLLYSFKIGRQYAIAPALFFAALVMLLINPKILFWDVGFQLSFAATLGLVYFMPVVSELTENLKLPSGLKTLSLTTLIASICTLPIILFYFGNLSLLALPANVLILPLVPLAMLMAFLSAAPVLGPGFAFVGNWIFVYILKVTSVLSNLPHSVINFKISPGIFWLMAGLIFIIYYGLNKMKAYVKIDRK